MIWSMLVNPWPDILKFLIKRSGMTKGDFADACGISRKAPSRYTKGHHTVVENFDKIAKGSGLTEDQLGYVYAWFTMKHYRAHRFELGLESEIREPELQYSAPRAIERGRALLELDMREIPAELVPAFNLMRVEVQEAVADHQQAVDNSESRLLNVVDRVERLYEAARDLKRKLDSGTG